jgi:hypothetical protein
MKKEIKTKYLSYAVILTAFLFFTGLMYLGFEILNTLSQWKVFVGYSIWTVALIYAIYHMFPYVIESFELLNKTKV